MIAAAGLQVAGAVAGGIMGAASARKRAKMLANEKRKNQAWYDRRYNEDFTERADAQAALTKMRDAMRNRSKAAAGTAAVIGSGSEAVAQEKQAQNTALGSTVSNITAAGEASKERIEQQYQQRDQDLTAQQQAAEAAKGQAIAQAVTSASSAAGGLANLIGTKDKEE